MILSVLVCARAVDTNGAAAAGARPAAPAIALVVLRKSRRDQPRLFPPNPIAGLPSWWRLSLSRGVHRDERSEEVVGRKGRFAHSGRHVIQVGRGTHLFAYRIMDMRSEEHTSELQSRFGISYAVF